jgi:hypothetical protein
MFSLPLTLPGKSSRWGRACTGFIKCYGVSAMSNNEVSKYFDLHTSGIGYISRIREVAPKEGKPFLSVTIAALRGSVENVQYTHFECHVSGKQAQTIVRELKTAVEGNLKVLIGFTLSDLYAESFTFKNGDKAGETGISLKARLLRVSWVKVDGQPYPIDQDHAA